jgi:ketopantoate reductase
MDQVARYREIVRRVIEDYAQFGGPDPNIVTEVIEDPKRDHFELIHVGWDRRRRIHGTVLHVDLIGGKIWIQHDGTERPMAEELVAAGVPKEDIVLAYKPVDIRPLTGYGVG